MYTYSFNNLFIGQKAGTETETSKLLSRSNRPHTLNYSQKLNIKCKTAFNTVTKGD